MDKTSHQKNITTALELLGKKARTDAPLGALTTYRVGGKAAIAFDANSISDLDLLAQVACQTELPVLFVGRGSNMLVADAGFAGVAVHLGERFAHIDWPLQGTEPEEPEENVFVSAGAAVALPVLARQSAVRGIGGLEWAVGVPGSVGGAVRMNAGGHGSDIAACLESANVFDLQTRQVTETRPQQLQLSYRSSSILPHQVVTSAKFACHRTDAAAAQQELNNIVAWRRANQPGGQNAGSVFVNPSPPGQTADGTSAGELIDNLGLKGLRVGCAHVSNVHANFIVADPDGKATDVAELIRLVQERVREGTGVSLRTEVRFVGFDTSH